MCMCICVCVFVYVYICVSLCVVTWTSSMVCTINMSCRSSMAPSIQLLNGADLLAYSRNSWSTVSSSFSVLWTPAEHHNNEVDISWIQLLATSLSFYPSLSLFHSICLSL